MAISYSGPNQPGDIVCYRGDTFRRWIRFRINGVEEPLGPSLFRMQIRNASQLIKELFSNNEIVIDSAGGGVLKITLSATVMKELAAGIYSYDLQQEYPNGDVKTRIRGSFTITEDITKPLS